MNSTQDIIPRDPVTGEVDEEVAERERPSLSLRATQELVPDTFLPLAEVDAEAQRCRKILDELPSNENTDMLYAAYNALLFVLSYGVATPSELFGRPSASPRSAEGWKLVPADDPTREHANSALPVEMIFAGAEALDKCNDDLTEEKYVSGVTPDWDSGMIAVAVWRAMSAAVPIRASAELLCAGGCGRPYSKGPDLVVSDTDWMKIAPRADGGGVLCPNCMHDRFVTAGVANVPAKFTSGPFALPAASPVAEPEG